MENNKDLELQAKGALTDAELADVVGGFDVGDTVYVLVGCNRRLGKILSVDRQSRPDPVHHGKSKPRYLVRHGNGETVTVSEDALLPV